MPMLSAMSQSKSDAAAARQSKVAPPSVVKDYHEKVPTFTSIVPNIPPPPPSPTLVTVHINAIIEDVINNPPPEYSSSLNNIPRDSLVRHLYSFKHPPVSPPNSPTKRTNLSL